MSTINTRDGSEDLRAVSKRFRSCFRNDKKLEKRSERVENYGKIILNTQQNAKNRISQVLRISQYRNFRSELPKYRMKNWPLPQYRKPQCPPRSGISGEGSGISVVGSRIIGAGSGIWLGCRDPGSHEQPLGLNRNIKLF